ncbi:MAG: hypothetical protein LKJ25_00310 [Clostridia bacterium]|jgi:hypothetical protein|nr:hypothetical protein [Clostridia bacterium]
MKKFVLLLVILFSAFFVVRCITYSSIVKKSVAVADTVTNENQDTSTIANKNQAINAIISRNQDTDLSNDVKSTLENENKTDNGFKDVSSFIPKGWKILKQGDESAIAEGDLNKDGIMDKAFVIEKEKDASSDYAAQRNLIIVFGNSGGSYDLSITAKNAILRADEGGTFGDPFDGIAIDRGSVLLKFMGGSDRWYMCFRFRYQDNGWYLIGFTENSYEPVGNSMECLQNDYNLITGDYIGDKLEDGKIKTIKKNLGKKQLLNLNDFVADEYSIQY